MRGEKSFFGNFFFGAFILAMICVTAIIGRSSDVSAQQASDVLLHSFTGTDGDSPYYCSPTISGSTLYATTAGAWGSLGTIVSMGTDGSAIPGIE